MDKLLNIKNNLNEKLNYINLLFKISSYINETFICYRIFKYNPTVDIQPRMDIYYYGPHEHYIMLLDTLMAIKDYNDESLSFRRSRREGIRGSCAMNINGINKLACIYQIAQHVSTYQTHINIYPLPHMSIIKDLIVDMKHFYNQYRSINPFLIQKYNLISLNFFKLLNKYFNIFSIIIIVYSCTKENNQSKQDRKLLDGLYECILCACCTTSCPSYWWNSDKYLGPAVLLQAYRWIIDSRDNNLFDRLNYLDDDYKLNRCHTILNCIRCCPKKLSPATAIINMKYIRDNIKYYSFPLVEEEHLTFRRVILEYLKDAYGYFIKFLKFLNSIYLRYCSKYFIFFKNLSKLIYLKYFLRNLRYLHSKYFLENIKSKYLNNYLEFKLIILKKILELTSMKLKDYLIYLKLKYIKIKNYLKYLKLKYFK